MFGVALLGALEVILDALLQAGDARVGAVGAEDVFGNDVVVVDTGQGADVVDDGFDDPVEAVGVMLLLRRCLLVFLLWFVAAVSSGGWGRWRHPIMELGQLVAGEDVVAEQRGQEAEPVGVQVQ